MLQELDVSTRQIEVGECLGKSFCHDFDKFQMF
jgi:hypothetical protein